MEDNSKQEIHLPFNNIFLNAGFINGDNSPSKYALTIIVTILSYFTYQIFIGFVFDYYAQQQGINIYDAQKISEVLQNPSILGISKNFLITLLLGMFVFTFLTFYIAIKKIHQKPFISVVTAFPDIRWNRVFFAFLVWSIIFILMFLADFIFISPENYTLNFQWEKFLPLLFISILLLPIQTSFEEIFFRGYLMQGIALATKNGIIALITTSLLFGLAHMSNPEVEKFGVLSMLPFYSLFGLFLGLLALWNSGLELSLGIHAANNLLSALLITSENSVLQTDAIFSIKNENPAVDFILWLIGAVITFVIFQYKYKFKNHIQSLK